MTLGTHLTIEQLPNGATARFDGAREVSIGRDRDCDVVVSYERASRRHVLLRFEPELGWVLEDQSSNGTFVDGNRVTRMVVSAPVVVRLGHVKAGALLRLLPAHGGMPEAPTGAENLETRPHPAVVTVPPPSAGPVAIRPLTPQMEGHPMTGTSDVWA